LLDERKMLNMTWQQLCTLLLAISEGKATESEIKKYPDPNVL
jgi:hypothetical protein